MWQVWTGSDLSITVPQGSYFILIDISDFLALPQFEGYTDLEFCEWMINSFGVAAVPGSSFFKEEVEPSDPASFARQKETLDEAPPGTVWVRMMKVLEQK